jgi:hypothetical protein
VADTKKKKKTAKDDTTAVASTNSPVPDGLKDAVRILVITPLVTALRGKYRETYKNCDLAKTTDEDIMTDNGFLAICSGCQGVHGSVPMCLLSAQGAQGLQK